MNWIWVFNGSGGSLPSGVFSTREKAEAWIAGRRLTGTLTRYPVDTSVYDWAVTTDRFEPTRPDQAGSAFIGRFSSAHLEHYHYEDGAGD